MTDPPLDRQRIEHLATAILMVIKANYVAGPQSRDRVLEVLNALAYCAAVTIRGSDPDQALQFFSKALNLALRPTPDKSLAEPSKDFPL